MKRFAVVLICSVLLTGCLDTHNHLKPDPPSNSCSTNFLGEKICCYVDFLGIKHCVVE